MANDAKGDFGKGVTVEKVNNVMGSTAGAGSGEFHLYRHGRRREMARVEGMEREAVEDEKQALFEERVESKRKECEERTLKNAEVSFNTFFFRGTQIFSNACLFFRNAGVRK